MFFQHFCATLSAILLEVEAESFCKTNDFDNDIAYKTLWCRVSLQKGTVRQETILAGLIVQ